MPSDSRREAPPWISLCVSLTPETPRIIFSPPFKTALSWAQSKGDCGEAGKRQTADTPLRLPADGCARCLSPPVASPSPSSGHPTDQTSALGSAREGEVVMRPYLL